jgi:hypothetical protein
MRPLLLAIGLLIVVGASSFFLARKKSPLQKDFPEHTRRHRLPLRRGGERRGIAKSRPPRLQCRIDPASGKHSWRHPRPIREESLLDCRERLGVGLRRVHRTSDPEDRARREVGNKRLGRRRQIISAHLGGGHSYPMAWCYRRMVDGDSDNVWVKYQVLKARASQPPSTTKE